MNKVMAKVAKINKEELSKVELGAIDDIYSDVQKISRNYEGGLKKTLSLLADIDMAILDMKTAVDLAEKIMPKVKEVDKALKDLGMKPDAKYKKATQDIFDVIIDANQTLKDLQKAKNAF